MLMANGAQRSLIWTSMAAEIRNYEAANRLMGSVLTRVGGLQT